MLSNGVGLDHTVTAGFRGLTSCFHLDPSITAYCVGPLVKGKSGLQGMVGCLEDGQRPPEDKIDLSTRGIDRRGDRIR